MCTLRFDVNTTQPIHLTMNGVPHLPRCHRSVRQPSRSQGGQQSSSESNSRGTTSPNSSAGQSSQPQMTLNSILALQVVKRPEVTQTMPMWWNYISSVSVPSYVTESIVFSRLRTEMPEVVQVAAQNRYPSFACPMVRPNCGSCSLWRQATHLHFR